MGPIQQQQLERMANFEFKNSNEKPFPENYLKKLARFLHQRAEQLAALPPASREKLLELAKGNA